MKLIKWLFRPFLVWACKEVPLSKAEIESKEKVQKELEEYFRREKMLDDQIAEGQRREIIHDNLIARRKYSRICFAGKRVRMNRSYIPLS